MGAFFGTRKPMVVSEFQNFKIFILFVTSLTLMLLKMFHEKTGIDSSDFHSTCTQLSFKQRTLI